MRNINNVSGTTQTNEIYEYVEKSHSGILGNGLIISNGAVARDIDITTGRVKIRFTDIDSQDFTIGSVSAKTLSEDIVTYVYVDYNSGSPAIVYKTARETDFELYILLGECVYDGAATHINLGARQEYGNYDLLFHRINQTEPIKQVSGGILSSPSGLKLNITAGTFWNNLKKETTSQVDTSGAGRFSVWYNSTGSFTEVASQTDTNSTQWDNDGVLTTMTTSYYRASYMYLDMNSNVASVLGKAEYATLSECQAETIPLASTFAPEHILINGLLIGRVIIQKSGNTHIEVSPVFGSFTQGSSSTSINQGDDVWRVHDSTDSAKKVAFQCSSISTGNTRTLTIPDSDGTIIINTGAQTINNSLSLTAGDFTLYDATNDGNPLVGLGSTSVEQLEIASIYDAGAQTLDKVTFTTKVASNTADKGRMEFLVDETLIYTVDDDALNLASGKVFEIAGTSVLSNNTLGSTVLNSSLTSVGTLTNLTVDTINLNGTIISSVSGNDLDLVGGGAADEVIIEGVHFLNDDITSIDTLSFVTGNGKIDGTTTQLSIGGGASGGGGLNLASDGSNLGKNRLVVFGTGTETWFLHYGDDSVEYLRQTYDTASTVCTFAGKNSMTDLSFDTINNGDIKLSPHGTGVLNVVNTDVTVYEAVNDGNPFFGLGATSAEQLEIASVYDNGAQTLDKVTFTTKVASATADKGKMEFLVDETLIYTVDDNALNLASGKVFEIAGTSVLSNNTLGSTVLNSSLTSVGTLTSLTIDNVVINGNDISSSSGNLTLTPVGGSSVIIDAPTCVGATINTDFGLSCKSVGTGVSWKGSAALGGTSTSVVAGELGGYATIGGHNATQTAWANLAIQGVNTHNIGFFTGVGSYGGGSGVIFIGNRSVAPSSDPTSGGILYAESGALKWRGSSSTVTTIANAKPHCTVCGKDYCLEFDNTASGYFMICLPCMINDLGFKNKPWCINTKPQDRINDESKTWDTKDYLHQEITETKDNDVPYLDRPKWEDDHSTTYELDNQYKSLLSEIQVLKSSAQQNKKLLVEYRDRIVQLENN